MTIIRATNLKLRWEWSKRACKTLGLKTYKIYLQYLQYKPNMVGVDLCKKAGKQFQERQGRCRIFIHQMFKMQNSSLLCKCKKSFFFLKKWILDIYFYHDKYTRFTMNVYRTRILLLQYSTVEIMFDLFCMCVCVFLPFYRHCFIPFILNFHVFMSFTFEFYYYNLVSVEISLCKRTSRALGLIITLSRIKKYFKVLL